MGVRRLVVFIGKSRVEHVHGHVVRTLGINWVAIDNDSKLVVLLVEFYASDSVRDFAEVDCLVGVVDDFNYEVVNVSCSDAVRPPEFRFGNLHIDVHVFLFYRL